MSTASSGLDPVISNQLRSTLQQGIMYISAKKSTLLQGRLICGQAKLRGVSGTRCRLTLRNLRTCIALRLGFQCRKGWSVQELYEQLTSEEKYQGISGGALQVKTPNPADQQRLSGHVFAQWLSIAYMTFAQACAATATLLHLP